MNDSENGVPFEKATVIYQEAASAFFMVFAFPCDREVTATIYVDSEMEEEEESLLAFFFRLYKE